MTPGREIEGWSPSFQSDKVDPVPGTLLHWEQISKCVSAGALSDSLQDAAKTDATFPQLENSAWGFEAS